MSAFLIAYRLRLPISGEPTNRQKKILISKIKKSGVKGGKSKVNPRTVHEDPDGIFCDLGA
jgi:hypothetical protein